MTYLIGALIALIAWVIFATLRVLNNPEEYDGEAIVFRLGFVGILFVICSWGSILIASLIIVTNIVHQKMKEVKNEQE